MELFAVSVENILEYFTGAWQLQRRISDQPLMLGDAEFTLNPQQNNQLEYHEKLSWPGSTGQLIRAQRAYTYRRTEAGLAIDFADGINPGALFLAFDFHCASQIRSHHLCIADHYDGRFVFHSADQFELSFQVVGPHKDYQISTLFNR